MISSFSANNLPIKSDANDENILDDNHDDSDEEQIRGLDDHGESDDDAKEDENSNFIISEDASFNIKSALVYWFSENM